MAIFYKRFRRIRTALLVCFLGAVFQPAAHAQMEESIFTVKEIKVDVTAENAIKAREQAFEQARQEAFKTLSGRMLAQAEGAAFKSPSISTISMLIQDYEVTAEKISSVRYIGTYTVRFRERAVKQYFARSGKAYSDVKSRPVLILPYYEQGGETSLWSPYNRWMQAWNRAGNLGGLVPIVLPLGDLQDVKEIGDADSLSYKQHDLQALLLRYGAGEAVIAIAHSASPASLTIDIYRTDRARPEYVEQIVQPIQAGQDIEALHDSAVRRVHRLLQKDWKAKTLISAAQTSRLPVRVPFKTLAEWTQTRRALQRVSGIKEVAITSISPVAAHIDLVFQGNEQRLRLALERANMTLSAPRFSTVGLHGDQATPPQPAPQSYDLYLNRYAPLRRSY